MANKELSMRNPAIVAEYKKRAKMLGPGASGDLIKAIWNGFGDHRNLHLNYRWEINDSLTAFFESYRELCGRPAETCDTLDSFFSPDLTPALESFFGMEETARIRRECGLIMECPYSHGIYRPAYRSARAGNYAASFFRAMVKSLDYLSFDMPLEKLLRIKEEPFSYDPWEQIQSFLSARHSGLDNRIALELRDGNEKIFSLVEEAILGDNSEITLNHTIIKAVVKSGNMRAVGLLGKLLLAAKAQEGLRQSILENCDGGTLDSHIYFIRLILENGLCRFSSVVRAFDTWSGLGYGDQKQRAAEKCMTLALRYLSDKSAVDAGLESNDTAEIYMALWALCCRDIHSATGSALRLLDSREKYRRLAGWYFITQTNHESFRHMIAAKHLAVRDPEELAWICDNLHINKLPNHYGLDWDKDSELQTKPKTFVDDAYPPDEAGRAALFDQLADLAAFIGKKDTKFAGSVFPWVVQALDASAPCGVMLGLAAYDRSDGLIRRLADFIPIMNADQRMSYYSLLLTPENPEHRACLLNGLSDKSGTVRERIVSRLQYCKLGKADIEKLAETLSTQNADLRKSVVTLLGKQKEPLVRPAIGAMLNSQNKNQLTAGIELLGVFSNKNPSLREKYNEKILSLRTSETVSQDVLILLEKFVPGHHEKEEYCEANGYGLYNPAAEAFDRAVYAERRPGIRYIGDRELKALIVPDEKELLALFGRIADVFYKYRDYEYEAEYRDGTREKVLLGNDMHQTPLLAGSTFLRNGFENPITDYPLSDKLLEAAGEYADDKIKLASAFNYWSYGYGNDKKYQKWFCDLFAGYPIDMDRNDFIIRVNKSLAEKKTSIFKCTQVLNAILATGETHLFDFAFAAYVSLVRKVPENQWSRACLAEDPEDRRSSFGTHIPDCSALSAGYLKYWRHLAQGQIKTDAHFTAYFNEMWYEYLAAGRQNLYGLSDEQILRAHQMGLISDDAIYMYYTAEAKAPEHMSTITGTYAYGRELLKKYPAAKDLLEKTIDRIVDIEENRGELPTPLSKVASQISRFDGGARHFVKLLAALGDIGFHRGYAYYYTPDGELTKKEGLSLLLRCCRPKPDDTPEAMRSALRKAKIPEKRVIEAAMYAPQWAGLLEKAMNIAGLKCGAWFFHAHVNEHFTAEKETEAAIFSAIAPRQFIDGAFDKDWFYEAYRTLGEKRFGELYKNAKYITSSSNAHRRSQLYADAVLGRLDKDGIKAEIIDKRNQEKLRAYALIPLDKANKNDALERYEFIQRYKKESRQFGALRHASESKAAASAMDNLAITTGYGDADRMTWALEGVKIEQLRPLTEPREISGVSVWLGISEDGTPDLNIEKNGKPQKTLPKELAKDEYIIELKEAVKQLRDQKRRASRSFEMAMVSRAEFNAAEVAGLLNHPVLHGMVSALVFASGGKIGFPVLSGGVPALIGASGNNQKIDQNDALIIAHPHDFIVKKCWSDYQRHLYQNNIVQPFKQVFREYYPVTQEEFDAVNVSRRYAGNQVQPHKAAALFKARGWTADYDEGLQRVWHKENLIALVFAQADWFSPSEIEAPAIETVRFYSRDKYEPVAFADIPPVIFSETMRDIDLAVSVAHAGGVDPEASHSTVEMRIAIARELLSALSIGNVSFQSAHAQIKGSLGDYSVHMGSGVIHKSGAGMIAVLPVHSQARGRIFLPFADGDPKTAEILSKILLFADDKKIKDPGILDQIM